MFNWEKVFQNKNIHDHLKLFNETIVNIVSNYIPNKCITCNNKDPPSSNDHTKRLINQKNEIFKKYLKDGKPTSVQENPQNLYMGSNRSKKQLRNVYYEHLVNKLNDSDTLSKAHQSKIESLANGKKVPVTPPILVNYKLVTNFKDKADIFNNFFSKQYQRISNNGTLQSIQIFATSSILSTVDIDSKILKLIQGLNSKKAHGDEGISIGMVKLCVTSVIKPLSLLFNIFLRDRVFHNKWKKINVISVHQKGNKQLVSNYRPLSLLSICSKIFKKLIFDCIYDFQIKTVCLIPTDQASGLVIPVYISLQLLHIVFLLFLMLTLPQKFVVFFWII